MNSFFLVFEYFGIYGFSFYLLLFKKELTIIYLPVIFFVTEVITPSVPAAYYYGTVSLLLLMVIIRNTSFFRYNIFAILISIYFLLLLPKSSDLDLIRPYVFSVIWLFLSIPLVVSVYQKYTREEIFKEMSKSSFLILCVFIANVIVSSIFKYSPHEMYGITSGVMYGNIWAAAFNTLSIALFIVLTKIISKKNPVYLTVFVVSLLFTLLSLRRSVMGISVLGIGIAAITLMTQKNAKTLIMMAGVAIVIGYAVIANTDFMSEFTERVELRKLDERGLDEEKRTFEYELLYKDMFVYKEYSPWFGFELFNSAGNYGRGEFGDRSLHGDIPNIVHSSGLIGLALYLLMTYSAFKRSWQSALNQSDKLIILFCAVTFFSYTLTGRYTQIASTSLLFLLLLLPITEPEEINETVEEGEEEDEEEEKFSIAYD